MSVNSGIVRTVKDKDHPYRLMNIAPLQDSRLTWEARGMLGFLLSKPDNWQVSVENLIKESPNAKRDKVQGILSELERFGYLVRQRVRNAHGHFSWESVVYETPRSAEEVESHKQKRRSKPPQPANPVMDEKALQSHSTITGSTVYGSTVDGATIDGEPAHISNKESRTHGESESVARTPRAPRSPSTKEPKKQATLNGFHEHVQIVKQYFGKQTKLTTAQQDLIVEKQLETARWDRNVKAYAQKYSRVNVPAMLDWYGRDEAGRQLTQQRTNGTHTGDYSAIEKLRREREEIEREQQQGGQR